MLSCVGCSCTCFFPEGPCSAVVLAVVLQVAVVLAVVLVLVTEARSPNGPPTNILVPRTPTANGSPSENRSLLILTNVVSTPTL
jgi:hypothetical protein